MEQSIYTFTPVGLAIVLLAGVYILAGPRHRVIPILVAVAFFVSMLQHSRLLGFNFTPHRILLLVAWIRVLFRSEHRGLQWNPIDKVLIVLFIWSATAYILLRGGDSAAIKFYLGECYDALGLYFLFRVLIRTREDILRIIGQLGVVSVVLAGCMVWEAVAHKSPLTMIGGVWPFVEERGGRLRCRAAFGHPVMAGLVGATLLPIWIACWWQDKPLKKWAIRGGVVATVITVLAGSGTPVGVYLGACVAFCFWRVKDQMRTIRWCIVAMLVGLQIVMKANVWDLLARVDVVSGNSAYHRANLIEQFYRHFGEWWALGVQSTASWGWDMWDVANQFLLMGKRGGFLAFVLFIVLLGLCFREVGRVVGKADGDRQTQFLAWGFGAALFANCVAFLGCAYWDQFLVLWYLILAMIASLRVLVKVPAPEPASEIVVESEVSEAAAY